MMSELKRPSSPSSDSDSGGGTTPGFPIPVEKRIILCPKKKLTRGVSNQEEIDLEVIRVQHEKLKQTYKLRQKQELKCLEKIQQLERQQKVDDSVLKLVNRYWNQMNEDIRILLQRFDLETGEDFQFTKGQMATSLIRQLSTWDNADLEDKFVKRVQESTQLVAKIIQAFERLQERSEKITVALKTEPGGDGEANQILSKANSELIVENQRIQALSQSLCIKYHEMSLKMKEMQEHLEEEKVRGGKLQKRVEDLKWEVSKLITQNDTLVQEIKKMTEKYRRYPPLQRLAACAAGFKANYISSSPIISSSSSEKNPPREEANTNKNSLEGPVKEREVFLSERELLALQKENENLRELVSSRLIDLENLNTQHKASLEELEKLRAEIGLLPESVIVQTAVYKCLQSKFCVVFNDNVDIRTELDKMKKYVDIIQSANNKHCKEMKEQEFQNRETMKGWLTQAYENLATLQSQYEKLRTEFASNLEANVETVPLTKEMKDLISDLRKSNEDSKVEAHHFRMKYQEEYRKHLNLEMQTRGLGFAEAVAPTINPEAKVTLDLEKIEGPNFGEIEESQGTIGELRISLEKAENDHKEMKLLLDMYKGVSREPRSNAQIQASTSKLQEETIKVRECIKALELKLKEEGVPASTSSSSKEKEGMTDEAAKERIRSLEEQILSLQRQVTGQKLEGEALLSELEVTSQAFEDIQDQNSRLIQQLKEKEDTNCKLSAEVLKAKRIEDLAKEERSLLEANSSTLRTKLEAQVVVVTKLEEQEECLNNALENMETQAALRNQATALYKKTATDNAQIAQELQGRVDDYLRNLQEYEKLLLDKTSMLEAECFQTSRLKEEISVLERNVRQYQSPSVPVPGANFGSGNVIALNSDAVLLEEIREYKEILNCPLCKVNRKDAVLIRCFHAFCYQCITTRYESRQRKCPTCNTHFGQNDYHRLYFS